MSKEPQEEPLTYEAPRALRLGNVRGGAGDCDAPGSGDAGTCGGQGNTADICSGPGSGAGTLCEQAGSSAILVCWTDGQGAESTGL